MNNNKQYTSEKEWLTFKNPQLSQSLNSTQSDGDNVTTNDQILDYFNENKFLYDYVAIHCGGVITEEVINKLIDKRSLLTDEKRGFALESAIGILISTEGLGLLEPMAHSILELTIKALGLKNVRLDKVPTVNDNDSYGIFISIDDNHTTGRLQICYFNVYFGDDIQSLSEFDLKGPSMNLLFIARYILVNWSLFTKPRSKNEPSRFTELQYNVGAFADHHKYTIPNTWKMVVVQLMLQTALFELEYTTVETDIRQVNANIIERIIGPYSEAPTIVDDEIPWLTPNSIKSDTMLVSPQPSTQSQLGKKPSQQINQSSQLSTQSQLGKESQPSKQSSQQSNPSQPNKKSQSSIYSLKDPIKTDLDKPTHVDMGVETPVFIQIAQVVDDDHEDMEVPEAPVAHNYDGPIPETATVADPTGTIQSLHNQLQLSGTQLNAMKSEKGALAKDLKRITKLNNDLLQENEQLKAMMTDINRNKDTIKRSLVPFFPLNIGTQLPDNPFMWCI